MSQIDPNAAPPAPPLPPLAGAPNPGAPAAPPAAASEPAASSTAPASESTPAPTPAGQDESATGTTGETAPPAAPPATDPQLVDVMKALVAQLQSQGAQIATLQAQVASKPASAEFVPPAGMQAAQVRQLVTYRYEDVIDGLVSQLGLVIDVLPADPNDPESEPRARIAWLSAVSGPLPLSLLEDSEPTAG